MPDLEGGGFMIRYSGHIIYFTNGKEKFFFSQIDWLEIFSSVFILWLFQPPLCLIGTLGKVFVT